MQFLITFLEGIITFVSPCLLPMLPIYISYFSGNQKDTKTTVRNSLAFVAGFSVVFIILGAFAGTIGNMLTKHQTIVNVVTGMIVIFFGLNYLGLLRFRFLENTKRFNYIGKGGFVSTFLFGVVFSIGWTPCVGAFLGSALMLASQKGSMVEGILLLMTYSLGLGIPFVLSAVLITRLNHTMQWIKEHYLLITRISGIFLIIVGILMATGRMGYLLALLS